MPIDYSKFDNIDTSSDEEKPKPPPAEEERPKPPPAKAQKTGDAPASGGSGGSRGSGGGLDREMIQKILQGDDEDLKMQLIQLLSGGRGMAPPPIKYHPEKSLHKSLFDPGSVLNWIDPALLAVIAPWREKKANGVSNDFSGVDLNSCPGFKVEAPGIISFPAFNDEFCKMLLEEVQNYRQAGMPSRAPNSMNNYGLVLNEIGMRPFFSALLSEVFLPIGARLFGDESDRLPKLHDVAVGGENWGGSSLDDHHSFIVQYRPTDDKHLDMHIDECDVTFNFGITPTDGFQGNDLTFCGMFDSDSHRKYHHTYKHVKGRCVVHSGKRRHGALDIEKGERASLIMWTKSQSYRKTYDYQRRNSSGLRHGQADRVCLSYTHDPDYKKLTPKKLQYHMKPKSDNDDTLSADSGSTKAPTEKKWVRVCASSELKEGEAKMVNFDLENEQVAVFRHRGELFALDNRCAHMGGPLCDGDIEDLSSHCSPKQMMGDSKPTDGVVKCPRHGMCFNLRTGQNIKGGHMRQKLYPHRIVDGDIEVEVELEVTSDPSIQDTQTDDGAQILGSYSVALKPDAVSKEELPSASKREADAPEEPSMVSKSAPEQAAPSEEPTLPAKSEATPTEPPSPAAESEIQEKEEKAVDTGASPSGKKDCSVQ